jgi:parallel beta-helix repeat protein
MKQGLNFKGFGLVILICLLFCFPTSVWAVVYYVDSARPDNNGDGTSPATAWKTVHYAIGQITNGDVLNVAEGIYSVVANGEANSPLTITQSNVTIQGAAGGTSILEGSSCASWSPGIEIASAASNVTIRNLAVRNFECDASDTGVRIASGATGSIIESCEIYNNDYGIYVDESSPEIRKNRIYDNYTGIYVYGGTGIASPSISNNLIYDTSGAMNNGIYVSASSGTASPTIHHNTIDGGTSVGISTNSGAGSGTPDIQYNIITNFGMYGIDDSLGSNIDYNDVWNNTSSNYGGLTTPGLNDINPPNGLDPLYQDPSIGNYELQFGSPCIDKIPSGASDPVADDIDGNPRPQDGDLDGTAEHDMGCYEYPVYTVNVAIFPVGGG